MNRIGARGADVVALGGGHGLYASLSALRILTRNITAIVTVADDGGSSGRLRKELDILPPGDLRMALSALCDDGGWGQTWRDVLQYRFHTDGDLNGHSMGNLLIATVWELLGDSVAGLDLIGQLLDTKGRVVPMSATPLEIEADIRVADELETIRGQVAVATCQANIEHVRIFPKDPPARPEAVGAVFNADWVIFGPGSWYTSVIPHLLVPELHEALVRTDARRMLVLNLAPDSETTSLSAADHVRSFREHAPDLHLDVVLVDPDSVANWAELEDAARECGARVLAWKVARHDGFAQHDPLNLAAAYREAFSWFPAD